MGTGAMLQRPRNGRFIIIIIIIIINFFSGSKDPRG